MPIAFSKPSLLFLLILAVSSAVTSSSDSDVVADLLSLQSQSPTGVIHLDDKSITRFITSGKQQRRSFSLLIFFDAQHLHDDSSLQLDNLLRDFGVVASSYIRNNQGSDDEGKIFFCDMEFRESQNSFELFGVNTLPHIRFIGPDVLRFRDSEKLKQLDFENLADSIASFVESKSGLTVGPIHRPPLLSKKQVALLLILVAIMTPFAVKKVIAGETFLHSKKIWMLGSLFVYFFSVSGTMHNIIRKIPMYIVNRNDPSKLVFVYPESRMQLGAEGVVVGFLYAIVGLSLALLNHVLVGVKSKKLQPLLTCSAIGISVWAVNQVVILNNYKAQHGNGE